MKWKSAAITVMPTTFASLLKEELNQLDKITLVTVLRGMDNGLMWNTVHATWQQRANALIKVKGGGGVKILKARWNRFWYLLLKGMWRGECGLTYYDEQNHVIYIAACTGSFFKDLKITKEFYK